MLTCFSSVVFAVNPSLQQEPGWSRQSTAHPSKDDVILWRPSEQSRDSKIPARVDFSDTANRGSGAFEFSAVAAKVFGREREQEEQNVIQLKVSF